MKNAEKQINEYRCRQEYLRPVDASVLGGYWPGIQLYYPPVKYEPSLGIYEDLEAAAQRMKKHAHLTHAHTLIFDLEDGCRQKEMSRTLLQAGIAQVQAQA